MIFTDKLYSLLLAAALLLMLPGCIPEGSGSLADGSAPVPSSQNDETQPQSSEPPAPSSPEYAKVVQGYSLYDIGLAINTDKTFTDTNRDEIGPWAAENSTVTWTWQKSDYYGNATLIHVDTAERIIDFEYHNMFVLQCFQEDELIDGVYAFINERMVPAADVRETCILKKDSYLICDITGFLYPGKSFQERLEERKRSFPDYDFDWALSVYDYVSENLLDLIVPETG